MSNTQTRELKVVRTSNQPLRLEEGEAVHVGVDVHKASYSVALFSTDRGLLATWVQPARPEVLLERLHPIRGAVAQVVYEAGPTGFGLARRLRAEGYEVDPLRRDGHPALPAVGGQHRQRQEGDCRDGAAAGGAALAAERAQRALPWSCLDLTLRMMI